MKFKDTDLILNADGSVYHLHLTPEMVSDRIIIVGDPDRVPKVSRFFSKVECKTSKREFVTHTGEYEGKRVTVISSGIGADNIEIVITELDALFNTDLQRHEPKRTRQSFSMVRVGTSGSLQPDIPVGSLLWSKKAIGLDNLSAFYNFSSSLADRQVCHALQAHAGFSFRPYLTKCSGKFPASLTAGLVTGVTLTAPGFYAPQGRVLRKGARIKGLLDKLGSFQFGDIRLTNMEMETAALYAMGRLYGHDMISLNAILASRQQGVFSSDPEKVIRKLILHTLDHI